VRCADDPVRPKSIQSPPTREYPTHEARTHRGAGQASEVQVAEERYTRKNHTHEHSSAEKNGRSRKVQVAEKRYSNTGRYTRLI
jgi:hypothetical protein